MTDATLLTDGNDYEDLLTGSDADVDPDPDADANAIYDADANAIYALNVKCFANVVDCFCQGAVKMYNRGDRDKDEVDEVLRKAVLSALDLYL